MLSFARYSLTKISSHDYFAKSKARIIHLRLKQGIILMKDEKYGLGETNFTAQELDELMNPALAGEKERQKKVDAFLTSIMNGDSEDNAGPYKLRHTVEFDSWLIPQTDAGRPLILNAKKGEYQKLIASASKKDGRRTDREGLGGQFMPVLKKKMEGFDQYKTIDGRALVRSLPKGISGLLIQLDDDDNSMRELSKDYFNQLLELAKAVEIEDKLTEQIFEHVEDFKNYKFLAATYKDKLWIRDDVAQIATHEDSIFINNDEIETKKMSGAEIISQVLDDEDYAGIKINAGYGVGRNCDEREGLHMSLNFLSRLQQRGGGPLRVRALVARSMEEFHLWLKQTHFATPYEIVEETDSSGRTFIYATSSEPPRADIIEWQRLDQHNKNQTAKFELKNTPGSADEIAAGTSSILCPALMACWIYCQLPEKHRKDFRWLPGKSVGIGRILKDEELASSKLRVQLANEILKLMPEGAKSIDRRSILTVTGAGFLAWAKFAQDRAWIESAKEQAKRFDKKFILGG